MNFERKFTLFMAGFIVLSIAYLFIKPAEKTGITAGAAAEQNQSQMIAYAYDTKTTGSI